MDMRLAYRIATMTPIVGPLASGSLSANNQISMEVEAIRTAPKIILDDVANFYAAHEKSFWDMREDVPNLAPPFPRFFAEWNDPELWVNATGHRLREDSQFGVLVDSSDRQDTGAGGRLFRAMEKAYSGRRAAMPDGGVATCDEWIAASRWVLVASVWGSLAGKPVSGSPLWMGVMLIVWADRLGKYLGNLVTGPATDGGAADALAQISSHTMHITGLGLSFMHCKNVTREEETFDRGERWHRRTKTPVFRFYTLNINPMREVLRREGRLDEVGMQRALHICRGHFATYTEEKPLFGRLTGTFWRPDHVRGSAQNGEIRKDYGIQGVS